MVTSLSRDEIMSLLFGIRVGGVKEAKCSAVFNGFEAQCGDTGRPSVGAQVEVSRRVRARLAANWGSGSSCCCMEGQSVVQT